MKRTATRRGVFYGWWIVGAALAIMTVGVGGAGYVFGVFFEPLAAEFGWTRAQTSVASTIMFLISGLTAPLVGRLTDRYGPRAIATVGAIVGAAAMLLLFFTGSLIEFYVYYGIFSIGLALAGVIPLAATIANWFVEKRGQAMGIIMTGIGLGGFLLIPFASYVVAGYGWRMAYASLGALLAVVAIPLSLLVLRARPQDKGLLPDGKTSPELAGGSAAGAAPYSQAAFDWSLSQALKTASFWLMTLAFTLYFFGLMVVLIHGIPFFISKGISPQTAGALLGTVAITGVVGKVFFGFLADRLSLRYLTTFCFIIQALALGLFVMIDSMAFAWAAVLTYGLSMGGIVAMMPLVVGRNFGLLAFGSIFGASQLVTAIAGSISPIAAGMVFDATGSYTLAFLGNIVGVALGTICIFLARPPQASPTAAPSPALSDSSEALHPGS